jgi:hypothetical protein
VASPTAKAGGGRRAAADGPALRRRILEFLYKLIMTIAAMVFEHVDR